MESLYFFPIYSSVLQLHEVTYKLNLDVKSRHNFVAASV